MAKDDQNKNDNSENKDRAKAAVEFALTGMLQNMSMKMCDDFVDKNASVASKAGLVAILIRETHGTPCEFCAELAGRYDYENRPSGIRSRHKGCQCTIDFKTERMGKGLNVREKTNKAAKVGRINSDKLIKSDLLLDGERAKENRKLIEKEEKIKSEVRDALGIPKAEVHLTPKQIDIENYSFDDYHINKVRQHNVTYDQAIDYVKEAKLSVTVWGGTRERYYGENGAVYVNLKSKTIQTAYGRREFYGDVEKIVRIIQNYEL